MPKNTFPTSIEVVRDLFTYMDTKSQLIITDSKYLDSAANKIFSSYYDTDLFLDQLCPKSFSDRTNLKFITLLKFNVLARYNMMLLHVRLTPLMNINDVRLAVWSNYLIPAIYKLVQHCISEMGFDNHWKGDNYIQESLTYLKNSDQKFKSFCSGEELSPDDKNYISKFGRKDAIPTPFKLKQLFPVHDEITQSNFELLCFACFMQTLKLKFGFLPKNKNGNFIKFLAEKHNEKLQPYGSQKDDMSILTRKAIALANLQTHFPFLCEISLSYQKLTPVFFERNPVKRITQKNPYLLRNNIGSNNFEINLLIIDQINKYLIEHKELEHLTPYIHWNKAINLVYQYQFREALIEYENCLEGLLYCDMRYLDSLINEMLCIVSLVPSQNKLIAKISNLAIQFDIKVGVYDLTERPNRFKTELVFEEWEKEAILVGFFHHFTAETFSDKGKQMKAMIPKMGSIITINTIDPDFKNINKEIYVDIEQRRKYPQIYYFVYMGEFNIAKKLIKVGAKINILNSNKDSLILLALNYISTKPNETYEFIKYLFDCGFDKNLLNVRTLKKRTTPLDAAIQLNLPQLVKCLLENGADPNMTSCYGISMLYQNLGIIKNILGRKNVKPVYDKYLEDSIKRYSNSASSIDHYKQFQLLPENNPKKKLFERIKKLYYTDMKIDDAYEILDLLLQYGADPNQDTAEHPIKGYTPFMLAVEMDNFYAIKLMLKYGARLDQTYINVAEGRRISLIEIATYFNAHQSKEIISRLNNTSSTLIK